MLVSGYDLGMAPPLPSSQSPPGLLPTFSGGDPQPANLLFLPLFMGKGGTAQDDLSHSFVESLRDIFVDHKEYLLVHAFDHVGPGNCSELQRSFLIN